LTEALEAAIARHAAERGLSLEPAQVAALAAHARLVLSENDRLHLTTIGPEEIVARHVGESLEGAAVLERGAAGLLVDLGSGNGYPGLPMAIARPELRIVLVESSSKKAEFLRRAIQACRLARAGVLERQIQRAADLGDLEPIDVLAVRAVGGWERILPRLVSRLSSSGRVLLWAGADVERVRTRVAWRVLRLATKLPLPARDASWIWDLRPASSSNAS
jgi:16S rRNA (guanine527-N7)-methyltransferase